jgi:aminomethyltransferase
MKKTPFYKKYTELGAKIVPFAGFLMPISYKEGIFHEVKKVREEVGVFDVSHMGEIELKGPDSLSFVSWITLNDPSKLEEFEVQYSAMCYENGGLVDDLLVYRLPDKFLLVVNAANTDKDYEWIMKNKKGAIEIENTSEKVAQLSIQGPLSEKVMQKIVQIDLKKMKYYWAGLAKIKGVEVIISRTGYTGEDGFEIYFDKDYEMIWDTIFNAGKEESIEPVGLGARDLLRLEMKYCLYGNDMDKTTTPLEAGLSWITKFDKGDFIGKDALLKQKQDGVKRRLVAFELFEKSIPRHGYKILKDGKEIGKVTSGAFSTTVNKGIGLGYIAIPYHKIGTEIDIDIRGKIMRATIVKPPFYKKASHK